MWQMASGGDTGWERRNRGGEWSIGWGEGAREAGEGCCVVD